MALNTTSGIATHIIENFNNIPDGVSGNMVETVDISRIHVQNYVGEAIDPNDIQEAYQGAITCFSKADTMDIVAAQDGGGTIKLAELTVEDGNKSMSSTQWAMMGDKKLEAIGRKARFSRSLS